MQEYNYSKLLGRLKEKGYTQAQFAREIGTNETSLNQRLKNKLNFKQDEILKAVKVLQIPTAEISDYFFNHRL